MAFAAESVSQLLTFVGCRQRSYSGRPRRFRALFRKNPACHAAGGFKVRLRLHTDHAGA